MIDWLRRNPRAIAPAQTPRPIAPKTIVVDGRDIRLVIRRIARARNMTLRLAPDGSEARVSIPHWGRVGDAVDFARTRSDWIATQLARIPPPQVVEPGTLLPYRGEQLRIEWYARAPRSPVQDDGALVVGGPDHSLASRIRRWLEAEALRLSGEDLAHYCARAGKAPPRLALSRAQRRWGSCAADGSIRINWRLVMAPDHVRRSVVAHEVAHMTHFDHSPAFHAHLAEIYEARIADADRWLKKDGRSLYRLFG